MKERFHLTLLAIISVLSALIDNGSLLFSIQRKFPFSQREFKTGNIAHERDYGNWPFSIQRKFPFREFKRNEREYLLSSSHTKSVLRQQNPRVNAALIAQKKCMGELGCFEITSDFFHPIYRPLNVLPDDRKMINAKFELYTRSNEKVFQYIKADRVSIERSYFNPYLDTIFIVHGFVENKLITSWPMDMIREFQIQGDYNLIVVDWSQANFFPYTLAVANARVVGAEIAHLTNFLKYHYSYDPIRVYLIGHSLGGQVVGYAGEKIKNLARITGLDPAGPYFENMPASVRLDPTDAVFVDVLHTNSKSIYLTGLGIRQLSGHVDFFPNNGADQPGCPTSEVPKLFSENPIEGMTALVNCPHRRSHQFFMETINDRQCRPVAIACPDWESFKSGRCASCGEKGERCATMGIDAIDFKPFAKYNESVKFYTITEEYPPFCSFIYQVQVNLRSSWGKPRSGSLTITVVGKDNTETFQFNGGNIELYPGATYYHLLSTRKSLGDIQSIFIMWQSSNFLVFQWSKDYIYIQDIKITPLNDPAYGVRNQISRLFCATEKGALESDKYLNLYPTNKAC